MKVYKSSFEKCEINRNLINLSKKIVTAHATPLLLFTIAISGVIFTVHMLSKMHLVLYRPILQASYLYRSSRPRKLQLYTHLQRRIFFEHFP